MSKNHIENYAHGHLPPMLRALAALPWPWSIHWFPACGYANISPTLVGTLTPTGVLMAALSTPETASCTGINIELRSKTTGATLATTTFEIEHYLRDPESPNLRITALEASCISSDIPAIHKLVLRSSNGRTFTCHESSLIGLMNAIDGFADVFLPNPTFGERHNKTSDEDELVVIEDELIKGEGDALSILPQLIRCDHLPQ